MNLEYQNWVWDGFRFDSTGNWPRGSVSSDETGSSICIKGWSSSTDEDSSISTLTCCRLSDDLSRRDTSL